MKSIIIYFLTGGIVTVAIVLLEKADTGFYQDLQL